MRKKLITVIVFLLVLLCGLTGTLLYKGYRCYEKRLKEKPLAKAVEEYTKAEDFVKFEDIDEDFVNAVISVEDKRFFTRKGYDFIALFRAIYHNFLARDLIEGGSTISEQIAKNLYLEGKIGILEYKIAEIFIMEALEKNYSKQELFALYANMNYYGDGFWGIAEAADGYYGKKANDLSLGKAAMLAGIPNAPAIYQLSDGYELAKERQEWVLSTMYNNGYISEAELEKAKLEDVKPLQ